MKNNKIICSHCKNSEVVKRGYFQTEAHGKQQRSKTIKIKYPQSYQIKWEIV